jgi:hypothetical protein
MAPKLPISQTDISRHFINDADQAAENFSRRAASDSPAAEPRAAMPHADCLDAALLGQNAPPNSSYAARVLRPYTAILRQPVYAKNLSMLLASALGSGVLDSGLLTLLAAVGGHPPGMPLGAMKGFESMERLLHGVNLLILSHAETAADTAAQGVSAQRQINTARGRWSRALATCGAVDAVATAVLFGTAWGAAQGYLQQTGVLWLAGGVRAGLAYKKYAQWHMWHALRPNLSDAALRQQLAQAGPTGPVLEKILFATLADAATLAAFGLVQTQATTGLNLLHTACRLMAVGGLLATLPKLFFVHQARAARCCNRVLPVDEGSAPLLEP